MSRISDKLLLEKRHRPWDLPVGQWRYYQEWNDAVFLHWKVPVEVLQQLVPRELELDLHQGEAWVSVVAFTMEKIRPYGLPSLSLISDFHEVNVRTYVKKGHRMGVYFLSLEAEKLLSAVLSKALSKMPYEKSEMIRDWNPKSFFYSSFNKKKQFSLEINYRRDPSRAIETTELDKWLVERYCAFVYHENELFVYDIHHPAWEINEMTISSLKLNYKIGELAIGATAPDLTHYSPGVQVLAWNRIKL